jgi:hypothetical protein
MCVGVIPRLYRRPGVQWGTHGPYDPVPPPPPPPHPIFVVFLENDPQGDSGGGIFFNRRVHRASYGRFAPSHATRR